MESAPGGIRAGGTKPGGEQAAVLLAMSKGPIGLGLDGKKYIGREREALCCGHHWLI